MSLELRLQRLQEEREQISENPTDVARSVLAILEEHLKETARRHNFGGNHSGLRDVLDYLGKHGRLDARAKAQLDAWADIRNCLAHSDMIQIAPEKATELLSLVESILKRDATLAQHIMTGPVAVIDANDSVAQARDLMIDGGFTQLPVVKSGKVVGLITARTLLEVLETHPDESWAEKSVAEVCPLDHSSFTIAARNTPLETILGALRAGHVAVIVTPNGQAREMPLGIITPGDLLNRL